MLFPPLLHTAQLNIDPKKRCKDIFIPINPSACIINQTYQTPGAIARTKPLTSFTRHIKKYPRRMQQCSICGQLSCVGPVYTPDGNRGTRTSQILTQQEIELLFDKGLQTSRDRTLFGVCLYTACRIAEACSLMVKDIYTNSGTVRSTINFRKANTKGKLQTRTIPVIEDLRSLLTSWKPNAGQIYLFPGRYPKHHWKHLHTNSADRILREAFDRAGIEGASTHSFRRSALTSDEQRRNPAADYSRNQWSQQPRTVTALLRSEAGSSQRSDGESFHAFLRGEEVFPRVQDELPAVPLPREQLPQDQSDDAAQEIPDW
ncbi:site-specific integrase [Microcoleus sp. D3_18_C4]|uniref:site-specific integrase n=1 Tax=Microcoleus sp. D3_18_C4 TaxID=3055335 RepID=UPI002FCF7576